VPFPNVIISKSSTVMTLAFAALVLLSSQLVLQPRGYAIHESCSEYNAQTPDAVKEAMEDVHWLVSAGKDHIGEDWSTNDNTERVRNTKRLLFHREEEGEKGRQADEKGEGNPEDDKEGEEQEEQEDKTLPTQADIDKLKGRYLINSTPLPPTSLARRQYGTAINYFL
jgi:hypothetical protein